MKKLMILLIFVLVVLGLHATEYEWAWIKQAGGTSYDLGRAIAVDAAGNSYVSGVFSDTVEFGTTTLSSNGGYDIFVAKLDPNGNWLWAQQVGDTNYDEGYAISVDAAGNSYVSGYFMGTATFGTTILTGYGDSDIFIAKLDADGNWLWAKQAGGTSSDMGWAIAVDATGSSYVSGDFYGTATFGMTTITSSGGSNIFVAKLDPNGNWLWVVCPNGEYSGVSSAIAVDTAGNSYISGFFDGTAIFGTNTSTSNGYDDIFVAKLDPNGDWLWAKQAGGSGHDEGYAVVVDANGNSYISGGFSDAAMFGTTTLTSNGSNDIFVAKLDPNGNWLWAKQAGGTLTDGSLAIAIDTGGNCYISGALSDTATFGTSIFTSNGEFDIFVAKLSPDGIFVDDELISPAASVSHLGNAYPNPFRAGSTGTIKADVPARETGVFTIYNLRGQVIQSHHLSAGAHELSVATTDLAPGIYFYRLQTPSFCEVKKLLVLK
ncbi:MAG: hypothetical protein CVU48_09815 [Candidatus Cloacimonetes bacterium HGW-Cloacimonetes-1]|jgi:hypothetical protein|nr:MAG: hypothetical protein CVU48_09815 [Candidatus Cloacimonetes bacterium HGW-Cloacimonetes-1]